MDVSMEWWRRYAICTHPAPHHIGDDVMWGWMRARNSRSRIFEMKSGLEMGLYLNGACLSREGFLRRGTTEACLKQEITIGQFSMSSEKKFGQALIIEGRMQLAEEALAGEDARILWISVALTGGMFLKKGPKWGGSEKNWGFEMAESLAVMDDLRSLIKDTK